MKKICLFMVGIILLTGNAYAQNLAINATGAPPNSNAILDVQSNNKGVLFPRMSSAERLLIPATKGLLVYDTSTHSFWYNTGMEWKTIASSDAWLINGNSGTNESHFLGTTDNMALNLKVNNTFSGRIDHQKGNTFIGFRTGAPTTLITENTATGHRSLYKNVTGRYNTATGFWGMYANTTGEHNTATGYSALTSNTSANYNSAFGFAALANSKGYANTAVGYVSLSGVVTGSGNTAVGSEAHIAGENSEENTAIGHRAMYQTLASHSVAVGAYTLYFSKGNDNTAIGNHALRETTVGIGNTAIGNSAGVSNGNLTNATAVGNQAVVNASNKVRIGNSAVTVIEGQVPFTTPSDARFKFNVEENVKGLDFILQLRPVTYQFDVKRFDNNSTPDYDEAEQMRRSGFIAQEVEKAAMNTGFNFSGLIKPRTEKDHYSLSYDAFAVPLVKAVQEQQTIIKDQQQQIDELKKLVQQLVAAKK